MIVFIRRLNTKDNGVRMLYQRRNSISHICAEVNNNALFSSSLLCQFSQIRNNARKHRTVFLIVREKMILFPISKTKPSIS